MIISQSLFSFIGLCTLFNLSKEIFSSAELHLWNLEILFCLCAVISKKKLLIQGLSLQVLFSVAVAAYGDEVDRIKRCNALALLQGK